MMHPRKISSVLILIFLAGSAAISLGQRDAHPATNLLAEPSTRPSIQPGVDDQAMTGTETLVFMRHGEKTAHEMGQLSPQGFNRAIALSELLPKKYGNPDFIFAPDPELTRISAGPGKSFDYVRPLATIEPTAIRMGMPIQTPCGFAEIDKLNEILTAPQYAKATIFIAWEHTMENRAVVNLMKQFGGNADDVPKWPGKDFDSLYVVRIVRAEGQPTRVTFTHDHEGLNHLSKVMPTPAPTTEP